MEYESKDEFSAEAFKVSYATVLSGDDYSLKEEDQYEYDEKSSNDDFVEYKDEYDEKEEYYEEGD